MKPGAFLLPALLLGFLAVGVGAQQAAKQSQTTKQRNQGPSAAAPAAKPGRTESQPKEYKAGETYALDDVVTLNEDNELSIQVLPAKEGSFEVKVTIAGKMTFFLYTFGQEDSEVVLVVDGKKRPALEAGFAPEVVASVAKPTLFTHMRTGTPTGTLVVDTNEHPAVFVFAIPKESEKGARRLELNGVDLGGKEYSLAISLDK